MRQACCAQRCDGVDRGAPAQPTRAGTAGAELCGEVPSGSQTLPATSQARCRGVRRARLRLGLEWFEVSTSSTITLGPLLIKYHWLYYFHLLSTYLRLYSSSVNLAVLWELLYNVQ